MEKAGKYAQASGNPTFITTHNQNLALLYLDMGETGLAKELLLKILDIYDQEQDASNLHVLALQILAPLYVEEKRYTEALELYEKALEIARQGGMLHNQGSILTDMADIYESQHQYKKALDCLKEGQEIKASLVNSSVVERALARDFHFEQREEELQKQILTSKLLESKVKNRNISLLLVSCVFVLIVLVPLLRNYKKNLKYKELESKTLQNTLSRVRHRSQEEKSQLTHQYQSDLDSKNRNLAKTSLMLIQLNKTLGFLQSSVKQLDALNSYAACKPIIHEMESKLRTLHPTQLWQEFKLYFEDVHPGFFSAIGTKYPDLTNNETRICALLYLNLNAKEIAGITNRSTRTVETAIYQIRKKLGISTDTKIQAFLHQIVSPED